MQLSKQNLADIQTQALVLKNKKEIATNFSNLFISCKSTYTSLIFRASASGVRIVKTIGTTDSNLDSINTALSIIQTEIDYRNGDTPPPLTFSNFITAYYLPHSEINHRDHSGVISRLRVVTPYLVAIKDKLLCEITKFDCIQVINSLRSRNVSPSTLNKYRYALQSIFGLAVELELIDKNPLKTIRKERVNNHQTRVLRGDELKRFLELSMQYPNAYAGYSLVLLITTGMRCMELLTLKWSFCSDCLNYVTLPMDKAGRGRVVYLNATSKAILLKLSAIKTSKYIFPSERTGQHLGYPRTALACVTKQLLKEGLLRGKFTLHSLRHTFATHIVEETGSLLATQMALGHQSSAVVTERYCHLSHNYMIKAVGSLDKVFSI